ncbi:acyl-CoA reductase [Flagellimonas flava]|uniref:Acyl-CoA reductase (LuxC) n=1 Tax=Flagellimonas flava TaxID=570519 RepID=A0A1M5IZJ0_9FLAO|nr:acyl-CoA reductase [Allomuricauda flava]SHG33173.1 Acyl-CoA reductase (LuxC) [Allomuricauda flava]
MSPPNHIVQAFVNLGDYLTEFCENRNTKDHPAHASLEEAVQKAGHQNGWFTEDNVLHCLHHWGQLLQASKIDSWLGSYSIDSSKTPKIIGVVMAGNIPLVGFHDFISVLLSGNSVQAKLSSNDTVLLPFLSNYLIGVEPRLKERINFVEGRFGHFDAVIATGSNNTSRYFEHYFGKKPNIIRKNRNAVAVLSGEESSEELIALGEDIFRYYGLGCRNVSKIFVPQNYNFDVLFTALFNYKDIVNQNKYANNYDYNKAVYLMSAFKILDNGFIVLKEDSGFASPIASLFYEYYDSKDSIKQHLQSKKEDIQCVVSKGFITNEISFGETQKPRLHDYADGVDTLGFLISL